MAFAPAPFSTRQRTTLLAIAALGLSACFAADRTPSEFPRSDAAGNSDPGEGGGPADTAQGDDTGEIVADVAGQDVAGDIPAAPDADNPAAPCEAVTAELQAAIDQLEEEIMQLKQEVSFARKEVRQLKGEQDTVEDVAKAQCADIQRYLEKEIAILDDV